MPEIPNVVSGEPVEADWGNDIRDRIIQRFSDATARTASLPFPQSGQLTWIDTPGQLDVWKGAAWVELYSSGGIDVEGEDIINVVRILGSSAANIEIRTRVGAGMTLGEQGGGNYIFLDATQAIVSQSLELRQGAVVTDYDLDPPTGPSIYEYQVRNAIVTDTFQGGTGAPSNASGQDGDMFFYYGP